MTSIERNPFTYSDARAQMNERKFRSLLGAGEITKLSRGLYQWADAVGESGDGELHEIVLRAPQATLALSSALSRHSLIDDIPFEYDIALPRGTWAPRSLSVPITWHRFDPKTFDLGRDKIELGPGRSIGLYSPERSIVDAFRMRDREGEDMAIAALKSWLRGGGQPSKLLRMARHFPRAYPALSRTMEILL
ncbi:type IV toxin-antitoxin system AbiEi family antitoxin domain-containing protein [Gordonia crocea]|uniref:Transcriptional regulator n=1 Tax=Gordonia crocea TaxID=589162 RepID=A0A7M3SV19_9ACTN|nr:hypothetical protein [Gordonia crocea]GED96493.1 hypothetical protein nbrc107697_05320 [Gordonia crocea]